jgi:cytochrome c
MPVQQVDLACTRRKTSMSLTRSLPLLALASLVAAPATFAADAANGKTLFETKYACVACHSTTAAPGGPPTGPTLAGIVGRKAATAKDFAMYTPALKDSKLTWNAKTLDEFLANPMGKVPGTMMVIPVTDPKDREDVIAYLSTLKAK